MKPVPRWRRYSRLFGTDPAADVKDEPGSATCAPSNKSAYALRTLRRDRSFAAVSMVILVMARPGPHPVALILDTLRFAASPWDAATCASMALSLLAVALISSYLPARRASSIDPITALRTP